MMMMTIITVTKGP